MPNLNARDNVAQPLRHQGVSSRKALKLADKMLDRLGMLHRAHALPMMLSGGEQQRVAISRALITSPRLILADEPTGALDTTTSNEVMDLIQKINEEGKTILVVTHEPDIAQMCKRIVKLKDGVIIEDKKVKQVLASSYV